MSVHQTKIDGWDDSLDYLAKELSRLRYDVLAEFLHDLSSEFAFDAKEDAARGRRQLASKLGATARLLDDAADEIDAAWEICEPHEGKP